MQVKRPISAEEIIEMFGMEPLPEEGGYYVETFRSREKTKEGSSICTSILFLITAREFSKLHRIPCDEIFHFYMGWPVTMLNITPEKEASLAILGNDIKAGQKIQYIVPSNTWQGCFIEDTSRPGEGEEPFALMGTTVAPGFEFKFYESAEKYKKELLNNFQEFAEILSKLT